MGRSVTCTFQCTVNLSKGNSPIYGAMTLRDVKGILLSEQELRGREGVQVVNIEIWAQTAKGTQYMKGHDYMIMDAWGKIDYYNIEQPVPFYTF